MFNIIFCAATIPGRPANGGRHALFGQAQAGHAPAHPRKRPAAVQQQGLRRGLDRRDHGECRTDPRRLLSAFQRQERALCRSRAVVPVRGGAQAVAAAAPRRDAQVARPEDRRRLFLARPFRRPRELLPADRAALGRGAQQRCREGCLSGRSGEAAWSPASRPRGARRARARPVAGGPVRRRHGRGEERGGSGPGPRPASRRVPAGANCAKSRPC